MRFDGYSMECRRSNVPGRPSTVSCLSPACATWLKSPLLHPQNTLKAPSSPLDSNIRKEKINFNVAFTCFFMENIVLLRKNTKHGNTKRRSTVFASFPCQNENLWHHLPGRPREKPANSRGIRNNTLIQKGNH